MDEARTAALVAINDGMTEVDVAKQLGVNRMTVRRWLGKL
jgi:transposase